MNPKIREALTRALPYLSEKRREVVVDFIMTNKFDEDLWYSHGESTLDKPTGSINIRTARLMKTPINSSKATQQVMENLHWEIDDYEYSRYLQNG